MRDETIISHFAENPEDYRGAVVPPIYQNSLFAFEDWDAIDRAFDDPMANCIYSRGRNPGVAILEEKYAKLAGGEKAKTFASGMGAISAAIMHCVRAGSHVVIVKNVYVPTGNFVGSYLAEKAGVTSTFVSGVDPGEIEAAIRRETSLIYLESPSSAKFSLQDIGAIAKIAGSRGIKTVIDNTWATFMYQKPLGMGIDLEVHSCSKYLGGHSDVVAGVVIGKAADIDAIFKREAAWYGAKMAPFDAWLLLRSLRTLPLRLARHGESALAVARFLEGVPGVARVNYPGLPSFPQHSLGKRQMSGCTGVFSFELDTDDLEKIKAFVNSLTLFRIGVSWGGHESLVYTPVISYLRELSRDRLAAMGTPMGTIRLSIGLEDAGDLISDIDQALDRTGISRPLG